MKRRIRHRDGTKISNREAQGLAELMHESTPSIVWLPADLMCMRCPDNQAAPGRLWCTPCAEIVDALPAEPVDDELEASIARHPAGKKLRAGESK